jgi:alkanesulfonate monooxygenase SsuD/methylene tetrahydromethanopterin reductase-like flavin-dependent oxidoreductase (luciferase family)
MAGLTEHVALAVDVLNVSLRHPFLLAGQLAVAQAASGGRVEVGLGAGSYHLARFDHQALGRPFRWRNAANGWHAAASASPRCGAGKR